VRQRIHASELHPGDVIVDGKQRRQLCCVEQRPGWAWPVASDGTGWAIALGDAMVEVERAKSSARHRACAPRDVS